MGGLPAQDVGGVGVEWGMRIVVLSLLPLLIVLQAVANGQEASFEEDLRPLIRASCVGCHSAAKRKGGVDLESATTAKQVVGDAETWVRAVAQVEAGFMPPRSVDPLDSEVRRELVTGIRGLLSKADPGASPTTLRRLNRHEYRNTVRDLLGVDVNVERHFPADAKGYGFDNVGDVMFLSPLLMERYLDVTGQVVDAVMATGEARSRLAGGADVGADHGALAARFLQRAFRRTPTEEELKGRSRLMEAAAAAGPEAPLRGLVKSALLSPHFLFRVETRPAGTSEDQAWPLSDEELAVRLSYMLWSTMPDEALAAAARAGELRDPDGLARQASRMLKDPRSRALADHFAAQWFGFDRIKDQAVEVWRFKNGFHDLRGHMYEEAARFFDHMVRTDQSVLRLLDSDETFLNQRLAKHYGIKGVKGPKLRLVPLPDRRRGGVLGMAAVLAPTATALRTSPTVRGSWVLETLLGMPPPPPPPDAGVLPADDKQKDGLTLRERLEQHRKDRRCASCHDRIDPVGFALENFDPTGAWRTTVHGEPVHTRARLPDGTEVDGPAALRDWLLTQRARFLRTMGERLLTYAVGRPVNPADEGVLQDMQRAAAEQGYRFSAMVDALVRSRAFRFRGG